MVVEKHVQLWYILRLASYFAVDIAWLLFILSLFQTLMQVCCKQWDMNKTWKICFIKNYASEYYDINTLILLLYKKKKVREKYFYKWQIVLLTNDKCWFTNDSLPGIGCFVTFYILRHFFSYQCKFTMSNEVWKKFCFT